jgi:hypothetical protein
MDSDDDDAAPPAAQPMPSYHPTSSDEEDDRHIENEPLSNLQAILDAHNVAMEGVVASLDTSELERACEEKELSAELRARLFSIKSRCLERQAIAQATHRRMYWSTSDDYCYNAKFESRLSAEIYLAHPDFFFEKCDDGKRLDSKRVDMHHMTFVARSVVEAAEAADLAREWERKHTLALISRLSDRERKRRRDDDP